jgi:hypothetical protein
MTRPPGWVIREPAYHAPQDAVDRTGREYRLLAIDWRQSRHLFREWKKTDDGLWYASRAIGIRFADPKKKVLAKQPWYQSDILELTRLKDLPAGLNR